jgi:ribosomal protein L21
MTQESTEQDPTEATEKSLVGKESLQSKEAKKGSKNQENSEKNKSLLPQLTNFHYAIVEACGHQFRVQKGDRITVNRMEHEEGSEIALDQVLLIRSSDQVESSRLGTPFLEGVSIPAKVVRHLRGEKIRVFKKRRRQGYQKTIGHRQDLTELLIGEVP